MKFSYTCSKRITNEYNAIMVRFNVIIVRLRISLIIPFRHTHVYRYALTRCLPLNATDRWNGPVSNDQSRFGFYANRIAANCESLERNVFETLLNCDFVSLRK